MQEDNIDNKVHRWLSENLGTVEGFRRQPRWRPGWDAEVRRGDEVLNLYVRGPRGETFAAPVDLYQEAEIHRVFERNGVLAPRVFGVIDDPVAVVMERLPGRINSGAIDDVQKRADVRREFIETVARVHAIPMDEFAPVGLKIPTSAQDAAMRLYGPCEDIFNGRVKRPFPYMRWVAQWLRRNLPQDRTRASWVNYDAGQFLHDGEHVTGLIDFELSNFGDPAAEFAGMRLRDTVEPLGNLSELMDIYEEITGDKLTKQLIEYHTAGFCACNGFTLWPLMFESTMEQDYTAYMIFSVITARWTLNAIGECLGIKFTAPAPLLSGPLGFTRASAHLCEQVMTMPAPTEKDEYNRGSCRLLSFYMGRVNEFGLNAMACDLADASELLGRKLDDWNAAQQDIEDYVLGAPPSEDGRIAQFFYNWIGRQEFILTGCGPEAERMVGQDLQYIPER